MDMYLLKRGRLAMVLRLGVVLALSMGPAAQAEPLVLADAVAEVVNANPSLAAIDARAKALESVPQQADSLPDPRLSLNLLNLPLDSFAFNQEAMTQFQIGISQALPYPGKLALRSEAAEFDAAAAKADVAERRLQLVRDVKSVWWNLFYLDRALAMVANNETLLDQFTGIAQTRYEVGQGLQQDVLLAQLELAKLRDQTIRLKQMRSNEAIRLNLLLGRPSDQTIELPSKVNEQLPTLMADAQLQQRAEALRPALAAQTQRVEAARSRRDLAKKDYAPDFALGAAYGLRSGNNPDGSSRADLGSIMFSMNLPLYSGSKQDRAVDQRNAEWLQHKYQLQDQHNQVAAEISRAVSDYLRSREQVELFHNEIVPQAQQTVDAMLAGYQVGKVDFLNLVRSQTTLYNYQTQYWQALSAANQALARLAAAVGEETIYE